MRYPLRWLVAALWLTLAPTVFGQAISRMESEYNRVAALFEQRDKMALRELRDYIEAYPYTTFEAEVYFMQGVLQTERGYYKKALKEFDKSTYKALPRPYQPQYQFYRGYAHLMQQEYDRAISMFSNLEKHDTPYKEKAAYYYAYCQYKLGNYDKAVPTLLELENKPAYKKQQRTEQCTRRPHRHHLREQVYHTYRHKRYATKRKKQQHQRQYHYAKQQRELV